MEASKKQSGRETSDLDCMRRQLQGGDPGKKKAAAS
jgi:hypothetical protein